METFSDAEGVGPELRRAMSMIRAQAVYAAANVKREEQLWASARERLDTLMREHPPMPRRKYEV
jgi:hypothetical protein